MSENGITWNGRMYADEELAGMGPITRTVLERAKAAEAEVETLRTKLRDQTQQTGDTYSQISAKVIETLRRYNAVPDDLDVEAHPIEQVVGVCLQSHATAMTREAMVEVVAARYREDGNPNLARSLETCYDGWNHVNGARLAIDALCGHVADQTAEVERLTAENKRLRAEGIAAVTKLEVAEADANRWRAAHGKLANELQHVNNRVERQIAHIQRQDAIIQARNRQIRELEQRLRDAEPTSWESATPPAEYTAGEGPVRWQLSNCGNALYRFDANGGRMRHKDGCWDTTICPETHAIDKYRYITASEAAEWERQHPIPKPQTGQEANETSEPAAIKAAIRSKMAAVVANQRPLPNDDLAVKNFEPPRTQTAADAFASHVQMWDAARRGDWDAADGYWRHVRHFLDPDGSLAEKYKPEPPRTQDDLTEAGKTDATSPEVQGTDAGAAAGRKLSEDEIEYCIDAIDYYTGVETEQRPSFAAALRTVTLDPDPRVAELELEIQMLNEAGRMHADTIERQEGRIADLERQLAAVTTTLTKITDALTPWLCEHEGVKATEAVPMILAELAAAKKERDRLKDEAQSVVKTLREHGVCVALEAISEGVSSLAGQLAAVTTERDEVTTKLQRALLDLKNAKRADVDRIAGLQGIIARQDVEIKELTKSRTALLHSRLAQQPKEKEHDSGTVQSDSGTAQVYQCATGGAGGSGGDAGRLLVEPQVAEPGLVKLDVEAVKAFADTLYDTPPRWDENQLDKLKAICDHFGVPAEKPKDGLSEEECRKLLESVPRQQAQVLNDTAIWWIRRDDAAKIMSEHCRSELSEVRRLLVKIGEVQSNIQGLLVYRFGGGELLNDNRDTIQTFLCQDLIAELTAYLATLKPVEPTREQLISLARAVLRGEEGAGDRLRAAIETMKGAE